MDERDWRREKRKEALLYARGKVMEGLITIVLAVIFITIIFAPLIAVLILQKLWIFLVYIPIFIGGAFFCYYMDYMNKGGLR